MIFLISNDKNSFLETSPERMNVKIFQEFIVDALRKCIGRFGLIYLEFIEVNILAFFACKFEKQPISSIRENSRWKNNRYG